MYLNETLELKVSSTFNLRSNLDILKFIEHRVPGPVFTNRCFIYYAPHLYNTLPKTLRQIENLETFKKTLKTYIFSETSHFESKTISDCFLT